MPQNLISDINRLPAEHDVLRPAGMLDRRRRPEVPTMRIFAVSIRITAWALLVGGLIVIALNPGVPSLPYALLWLGVMAIARGVSLLAPWLAVAIDVSVVKHPQGPPRTTSRPWSPRATPSTRALPDRMRARRRPARRRALRRPEVTSGTGPGRR